MQLHEYVRSMKRIAFTGIQQTHLGTFDVDKQKLFFSSQIVQCIPSANFANLYSIGHTIHFSQRCQCSSSKRVNVKGEYPSRGTGSSKSDRIVPFGRPDVSN